MFDIQDQEQQLVRLIGHTEGMATKTMSRIFSLASQSPIKSSEGWSRLPPILLPLFKTLTGQIQTRALPNPEPICGDILVGFSGGKDSTAAAIKASMLGGNPILFYVQGINKAYPREKDAATELAGKLGFDIVYEKVTVTGSSAFVENPIKNQYILALMVDYGMLSGVSNFTQGNLMEDTCSELDISFGYSDGWEMFEATRPYFESLIKQYKYHHLVKNDSDSLSTIINHDISLLLHTQSCMTPIRYRGKLHKDNQKKYGVSLLPERCGSCYKCCLEWLHLMAWDKADKNDGFARHCVDILVRGLSRTFGREVTRKEAVDTYFDEAVVSFVKNFI